MSVIGKLLVLTVGLALPGIVHAQAIWTEPVEISFTVSDSYVPNLVSVDAGPQAGRLDVFWHDFTGGPNLNWCNARVGGDWEFAQNCDQN